MSLLNFDNGRPSVIISTADTVDASIMRPSPIVGLEQVHRLQRLTNNKSIWSPFCISLDVDRHMKK